MSLLNPVFENSSFTKKIPAKGVIALFIFCIFPLKILFHNSKNGINP